MTLFAKASPPGGVFWLLVLGAIVLFLGLAWLIVRIAIGRARREWGRFRPVVEAHGLQLFPYSEGAGDDEDESEDKRVREARHRILEFGKGLCLFQSAAEAITANLQPIAEGKVVGVGLCIFHLRFHSDESRANAWVCDKTVVGAMGAWRLPRVALLPRGLAAGIRRTFDAVDYELGDLIEQPLPATSGTAPSHLLLAADEHAARALPRPLLEWLARNPSLSVEAEAGRFLLTRGNRPLAADDLALLLDQAVALAAILRHAT